MSQRFGLYADLKLSVDSPRKEESCCPYTLDEAEAFGDQLFQDKSAWRSFDVAIVRVVGPQLAVYAGGGASRERAYRQYFDQTRTRGNFGAYWVEDTEASGTRVNVLGGLIFHASRNLMFVFGGELERIGRAFRGTPLLANMLEDGATPLVPPDELFGLGFQMIAYPVSLLFRIVRTWERALADMRAGTVRLEGEGGSFADFKALIGLDAWAAIEDRFGR